MCVILLFYCYIIAIFLMIISLINILYLSINTVFNCFISTYSLYIIHPSIFLRYITFVDVLMLIPRRSVFGLVPPLSPHPAHKPRNYPRKTEKYLHPRQIYTTFSMNEEAEEIYLNNLSLWIEFVSLYLAASKILFHFDYASMKL